MQISIGSDHRGYELKQAIQEKFSVIEWIDVGTHDMQRVDYPPPFAKKVVRTMTEGQAERGILLCGSGIGMAIAANRVPGIYAAVCWSKELAYTARKHDGINVLVLAADYLKTPKAFGIVEVWLETAFLEGRYQKRLTMLDQ